MPNPFRRSSDPFAIFREIRAAIDSGDPALVRRAFVRHPEQINSGDAILGCHLHHACRHADVEVVAAMVRAGADIDLADDRDGMRPIVGACSAGNVDIVRLLLEAGCLLDSSASVRNPLFACIGGYRGDRDEPRGRFATIAELLIRNGMDLTACYVQQSMVDMDAAAFAYMFGRRDIAAIVIRELYGDDERLAAGAWAEAIEVALGNAYSRQKFRRLRYPPKGGSKTSKPRTGAH